MISSQARLKKFLAINWLDLIFLGLIILSSIYAWHGVLNQMIEGEGYYYFAPGNSFVNTEGEITNILTSYDNFPRFLYFTLEKIFGANMDYYMQFLLASIVFINISFYLFIRSVTKNKYIALLGAVFAGISYASNYQFYARGHFQWFAQRVPEFFPTLLSFYFSIKFINGKKYRYYWWSLGFFVFSILMSHYTTLLLPFYPAIYLAAAIFQRKKGENFIKYLILSFPFIFVNFLIVSSSSLGFSVIKPNQSFLGSIFANKDLLHQISFQLTAITIPYAIFKSFIENLGQNPQEVINNLIIPVYVFYFLSFWLLYRKRVENFYIYVGLFLATLGNLFLNVYLNRVKVYNEIQQGRYYFIPSFFTAVLLSSFIYYYFKIIKFIKREWIIAVSFLFLTTYWTWANSRLIHKQMKDSQYVFTGGRLLLEKLNEESSKFPKNAFVMLPNPLMPLGEDFLMKFYGNGTTKFIFIDIKWKQKLPENLETNKLFVYDYNDEFRKGGGANSSKIVVLDKSEEYRRQISR